MSLLLLFQPQAIVSTTATFVSAVGAVSPVDGVINQVAVDLAFTAIQSSAGNQGGLESNISERYAGLTASATTNQFAEMHRSFFNFDTSSIGAGNTVISASLTLIGTFQSNGLGSPDLHISGYTPTSTAALAASDFSHVGTTSFGLISYASFNSGGSNLITFNASGIAAINKTGITSLAGRTSYDILNSFTGTWGTGAISRFEGFFSDNGTNKPVLTVTYSAGGSIVIACFRTLFGIGI